MPLYRKFQLYYNLVCNNFGITNAKTVTFNGEVTNTPSAGAVTVDWTAGQYQNIGLNAAPVTITWVNPVGIGMFHLKLIQSVASSTVTWPVGTIKWLGRTAPTLQTTLNYVDFVSLYWDGTYYWGTFGGNYG